MFMKKYLRWTIENHKRAITKKKKIPKHFISLLDISGLSRVQNIYISFSSSAFCLLLLCLCGILNWRRSSSNVMMMKMKCNNDKINSKQLAVQDVNKLISGKQKIFNFIWFTKKNFSSLFMFIFARIIVWQQYNHERNILQRRN